MDKESNPFEFGIIRILDCGFMIEEAIPNEPNMEIGYGMHLVYDIENNWFQINIKADFKQPTSGIIFITGTVLTRFFIKDLVSFVNENGKLQLPNGSAETFFSIAFGHMRAILAKNIAGSRFSNMVVPVIYAAPLFNELLNSNIQTLKEMADTLKKDINIEDGISLFEINKASELLKPIQ
jgi:hypothetical protein